MKWQLKICGKETERFLRSRDFVKMQPLPEEIDYLLKNDLIYNL